MYDYRDYLMTIAAIFLALALGILIGISFGDDFLVSNQREIIEMMEREMERLREAVLVREGELKHWEEIKPLLQRAYRGTLQGKSVLILSRQEETAREIGALLNDTGAVTGIVLFMPAPAGEAGLPERQTEALLELLLQKEVYPQEELSLCGAIAADPQQSCPWPPDCFVLLPGREMHEPSLQQLWQGLRNAGKRVVVAYPWEESGPSLRPAGEAPLPPGLVDNIDTYWGRLALLEMLAFEIDGHYGFGPGSEGLVPSGGVDEGR